MEHLQAPWKKTKIESDSESEVNEYYRISSRNDDGDEVTICEVEHYGMEWEQFEAHARLITAAPEMLKALKEALESLEYAAKVLEAPEKSAFRENIESMRAAIAKAEEE